MEWTTVWCTFHTSKYSYELEILIKEFFVRKNLAKTLCNMSVTDIHMCHLLGYVTMTAAFVCWPCRSFLCFGFTIEIHLLLGLRVFWANIKHSQLKRIILKFNSSSIALLTMCISQCCHNRVLYWVYTDPYCFVYWIIREHKTPADRSIRRINSFNIALPRRTILEV